MNELDELLKGFPGADKVFLRQGVDRNLVLAFLMAFARAEHALKDAGFADAGNGAIYICWDRFAREMGQKALSSQDASTQEAIDYVMKNPPNKQALGPKRWKKRKQQPCQDPAEFLIQSVRVVRNNLFHGGKEMASYLVERDSTLIQSCLLILRHLVNGHESVKKAFEITGLAHAG
jgi:hypothetical protein